MVEDRPFDSGNRRGFPDGDEDHLPVSNVVDHSTG